ncbi:GPP34-domain-containing protein [Schizopora paradoxa]|uniref:GPP34-domain-containing protein n=1 Tax=Schizopora paradoxa TaxID=27342 RepID=A0A0H2RVL0_9AGAM|nr:GPP34-domain-containing protein [Schizopora paradoxa]
MASSGLSRRRVGASSSTQDDELGDPWGSSNGDGASSPSSSSINGSSSAATKPSHAGSAFEGGSKIAYDPKELDREKEEARSGGRMPKLTIMEEVFLLGLKDKEGYLSLWNDNISYALRGCLLLELALRRRISVLKDANQKRVPVAERLVEVVDERLTGETILDEAFKLIKSRETARLSVKDWIDLLSGETWDFTKIGFQLKQVRERLAKGLVDKGVLRTEKRNFLLFDLATHPLADANAKRTLVRRCVTLLTASTEAVPPDALGEPGESCRVTRAVCLVCASYAASVLDNAFPMLGYEDREAAQKRAEDILAEFASWPFGGGGVPTNSRRKGTQIGAGGGRSSSSSRSISGLIAGVKAEMATTGPGTTSEGDDLCFELVAGVMDVLFKLDSLL